MSWWGTIDACFRPGESKVVSAAKLQDEFERRGHHVPTGSENGPTAREHTDGVVNVYGRLRDVGDSTDALLILSWFVQNAQWCDGAEIMFEFDSGPRYRYEWKDGGLRKLKGVLDL